MSSVVMWSSIAISVTMWVLKRQLNRNNPKPGTKFSGAETPNHRIKDKITGMLTKYSPAMKILELARVYFPSLKASKGIQASFAILEGSRQVNHYYERMRSLC